MKTKIGYLLCIGSLLFAISVSKDQFGGRYLKQNRFYQYAGIGTKIQSATPRLTRSSLKVEHKEKYLSPTRFLPAVLSKETNEEKYSNKLSTSAPKGGIISEIETVQDFLIKLGIKPLMYLLEISIFSLNNVILRLTKIMNRADKNWAHF